MKILIAEDDEDKLNDLSEFFKQRYAECLVTAAKSLQSSLESIFCDEFDLIILDMTMPNFDRTITDDGGRPHAFAGREILRQMKREGVRTPVIVATHFHRFGSEDDYTTLDQLRGELESRFPNYQGTVQYRGNIDQWKNELEAMISRAIGV